MSAGVLHIVRAWEAACPSPDATDSAILACVEHVLARKDERDRVLLIAGEEGEKRAAALGLRTPFVLPPRTTHRLSLDRGLSRVLRGLRDIQSVLVWSGLPADLAARVIRKVWSRPVEVSTPELDQLSPRRIPTGSRSAIRATLQVPNSEVLIALASDPPDSRSAHELVRAAALTGLSRGMVTALVPRRAVEMSRAKATVREIAVPVRLVTSELPVWSLLPACDLAILDVHESARPHYPSAFSARWMAETCAALGVLAAWPAAPGPAPMLLRPASPTPVSIARSFYEHERPPQGNRVPVDSSFRAARSRAATA